MRREDGPPVAPIAWVLNLDAEHELESGPRYAPTRHLRAIVARESRRLAGNLVAPGDRVLSLDAVEPGEAEGLVGLAWSPTPRALRSMERAGARRVEAPDVEVLRRVNARPFATEVRRALAWDGFAKDVASSLEDALRLLARPAELGWLVRRSFGAAGRGRRRLESGRPSQAEVAWLAASLRRGPLVIEAWVRVTREFTRSGWVSRDGGVVVSGPCFQETTETGSWTRTQAAGRGEVARTDDARLEEACATAGSALAAAGYFGPFGIDAFRHRAGSREILNPLSEINARFTMDWATGMSRRPEREVDLALAT